MVCASLRGILDPPWDTRTGCLCLLPPAYVVRREGNSFTLFVCPHLGGYPYPIMLCNIFQNAMRQRGGYPDPPRGGVPDWVPPLGGYPDPRGVPGPPWGGVPDRVPPGGVPGPPGGVPDQVPRPGGGVPDRVPPPGGGYPGRTTEGVLTTRRAVCLLRSRRRTFLFII